MIRRVNIVAALLLLNLGGNAAAAENPEQHKSKNAQKILATLNLLGINNNEVKNFVAQTDSRVSDGYFYVNEQKALGGNIALRYQLSGDTNPALNHLPGGPSIKRLQLNYTPKDSNIQLTAHTRDVMLEYHLSFR